jgi:hypothetical protein
MSFLTMSIGLASLSLYRTVPFSFSVWMSMNCYPSISTLLAVPDRSLWIGYMSASFRATHFKMRLEFVGFARRPEICAASGVHQHAILDCPVARRRLPSLEVFAVE